MFRANMRVYVLLLIVFSLPAISVPVMAADLSQSAAEPLVAKKPMLPTGPPLHVLIDKFVQSRHTDYARLASPVCDDAEFLRRIYLDMTGRIPTISQTRDFLSDQRSDKRSVLIDQLLNSPESARFISQRLDVMLMQRMKKKYIDVSTWEEYLRKSVAENKPLDQLVREILSADGSDKEHQAEARFYLARSGEVNELTRDISRIFLGADLTCAQCHDHPEVADWKQDHYYGISAFLIRSFVFTDKKKKQTVFAEKAEGEVKFESVFEVRDKTSKGPETTLPAVFDGKKISEPAFKKGEEYKIKPAKDVRPIPKYSRRAQLGDAITRENRRFARTMANRLWAMLLGRGIVHPLDEDNSDNPPSHPELLEALTAQLMSHDYDLRWYLREIALSETYQRSSANDLFQDKTAKDLSDAHFTHALLKPLNPEQYAWAVMEATGLAEVHRNSLKKKLSEATLRKNLLGYERQFVSLFGGVPGEPVKDFEATADQILYLSNDQRIQVILPARPGNLADRLMKIPADQADQLAEEMYLSVLTRHPLQAETEEVTALLAGKKGQDRAVIVTDLIWALLMSSEFRFNH
ncbi:DUF1549 domain-containing protein [Gimesia algae]|uniref:Cytochrome c domain-containing protein n=1 Tax=Gimesia algae TaxID=2527971 RepID=A0A517VBS0_9PLAN|nr:DUF1549 domain-containing protein [Gimesia algae]QDT90429.1 hypothetical protein Pan161_20800 [Gimesia algae]